jgi:hypothetical protein
MSDVLDLEALCFNHERIEAAMMPARRKQKKLILLIYPSLKWKESVINAANQDISHRSAELINLI